MKKKVRTFLLIKSIDSDMQSMKFADQSLEKDFKICQSVKENLNFYQPSLSGVYQENTTNFSNLIRKGK